jgi:putrescine aminotransferase
VQKTINICAMKRIEQDMECSSEARHLVDRHCHQFGLLLRPLINVCILSPPLIITRAQIDDLVAALRKGLDLALEDLRAEGIWRD